MLQHVVEMDVHSGDQRRIGALTTLLDVALRLSGEHLEDQILEIVTQEACVAVPCERASLFLLDSPRGELFTRTVTELELREIRLPIGRGIIGWVARECVVARVNTPTEDDRWDASFDQRTGFATQSILAVPVLSPTDGSVLGVLQLLNARRLQFDRFDEHVAQAFAAHAAAALERTRLQAEAQRAAILRRDLEMARRIQLDFLPERMPDIAGYELAACWQPAEIVSGDYYDWFRLPDDRLGIVVGDVSGHGLHSSLIMASIRAMLRIVAKTTSDPEQILNLLDDAVNGDLKDSRFISFLVVAFNPHTHECQFANAGHAPAVHIGHRTRQAAPLAATRLPLGFPRIAVGPSPVSLTLDHGDLLVLGTDGIIEARNRDGEMFGMPRLLDLLLSARPSPAEELVNRVSEAVRAFHGQPLPADDTTLMILQRTMPSGK